VLTVGIAWIVILTYICCRGIQVSARLQVTLLAVEIFMLLLLAVVAIVRSGSATRRPGTPPSPGPGSTRPTSPRRACSWPACC
jgi:amino acid transporter